MCRSPCRSPSAHRMRQSDFNFHIFFMFILIIFTPLLTPLLFSKGFSSRQYSLHYFFDQQKTFGNYVQTILGRQYFDELNGTQSRISSHYVITRSYTLVQASDNPRQKYTEQTPLPVSMLKIHNAFGATLTGGVGASYARCDS